MHGRKNAAKVLWFVGLFLVVTGVAIFTWLFQSLGGGGSSGPILVELNPGESIYRRGYSYYRDITDLTIVTALHPQMSYNFNMTKVGGTWTFNKSGAGHDTFSVKPPIRGVYEWTWLVHAGNDASGKLKGNVMETVNTWGSGESFVFIGLGFAISGLAFLLSSFLLRGVKRVP